MGWQQMRRILRTGRGDGEPTAPVSLASAALACFYLLLVPLQLVMLPGHIGVAMAALSAASAAFLGTLALILRVAAPPTVPNGIVVAVGAVPIGNACLRIVLSGEIRQTTWLILAIIGAASFVSGRVAVTSLIGGGVLGWAAAVSTHHLPSIDVTRAGFQLGLGVALAAALQTLRIRREAGLRAANEALAASEERYRTVFTASPVGISLSDERGLFVEVNEALCKLLGRPATELLGRSALDFTHPDDRAEQATIGERLTQAPDGIVRLEKRYVLPDGQARWGWLTLTHTPGPNSQPWTLAHMHDSHDRKLAEQSLIESEANLTAVADVMHRIQSGADARQAIVQAGIDVSGASFVCLLEPRPDMGMLHVSASTEPALLGTQLPLDGVSATGQVYRSGHPEFVAHSDELPVISSATPELSGARSIYLAPVSAQDMVTGVLMVGWRHPVADLGDRRIGAVTLLATEAGIALRQASLLSELEHLAHTDQLTGLPNRRGWDEQLGRLIAHARRSGNPLTVALADLDHFKRFNDTFGHPAGDQLLKDLAHIKTDVLRGVDVMARWGGEEFAIALPDCPSRNAPSILDRVRESIPDHQTCSIGFATWDGIETADELLSRVDSALYVAKSAGRNRTCGAPSSPIHILAHG